MIRDFRVGLRALLRNPGFTAVAVLTLALGIGANVSIFAIVSLLYFEPLPVRDPDRLVMLLQKSSRWDMPHGHSWLDYLDYRDTVGAFSDVLATSMQPAHLTIPGRQPERAWIEAVSGNYFEMLGVEPAYGRLFRTGEGERAGADPVIVLSHGFWQGRCAGDPSIVGRLIAVNGHAFTVVGIAPPQFSSAQWGIAVHAFVPASMVGQLHNGGEAMLTDRGAPLFKVMARLAPGSGLESARAVVGDVARRLSKDYPQDHKGAQVLVVPERRCRPEPTFSQIMPAVTVVFMSMMILVLLIACANVANLLFSRALVRQREMAVRHAIGGSRARLMRQLLTESLLLGLLAGIVGCVLAYWSGRMLAGINPAGDIPIRTEQRWGWTVFAFAGLLSFLAGIITGLGPAWRATSLDLHSALKRGTGAVAAAARHPLRSSLVISQVAISVIVLVCGGVFVGSLQKASSLDLGFRTDHLVMASIDPALQGYDDRRGQQLHRRLLERLKSVPGVRSASLAASVPFGYGITMAKVAPEEKAGNADDYTTVHCNRVDPAYFGTMGTRLVRGRGFGPQDVESTTRVAVINAAMAQRFWGGRDAIGQRFRWGQNGRLWEVVGVVATSRYVTIAEAPRPSFFVPIEQTYASPVTIHLWTSIAPGALLAPLRQALNELDPALPVYDVRTMDEHLRTSAFATMPIRMGAMMAGIQGLVGLLVAMMGIYGVVSYTVRQREQEIGIRMALGATRREVLQVATREGVRLSAIGLTAGLLTALGVSRLVSRVLYGLSPSTGPLLVAVGLMVGATVWLACYLPARRATRVDPMKVLRCQ